jgi:hypothetical protein
MGLSRTKPIDGSGSAGRAFWTHADLRRVPLARFVLFWRRSCNDFGSQDFHGRYEGHANTLPLILDTDGNVFGDFVPLTQESRGNDKSDESLRTFLIALKNRPSISARRFALHAEQGPNEIDYNSSSGPLFGAGYDIIALDKCNGNTRSCTSPAWSSVSDTELRRSIVLRGSRNFPVSRIEVFEITD